MDELLHKAFGLIIAFVCPGFVGLWTVSRLVEPVRKWFGDAATQETSVGGFLFLALAAIGVGVFLGGVRFLIFDERLFKSKHAKLRVEFPDFDVMKRGNEKFEAVYLDLRESYFRYFQFYSHTLVILPLAVAAGLWAHWPGPSVAMAIIGLALIAAYVLFVNAYGSIRRYVARLDRLLGRFSGAAA